MVPDQTMLQSANPYLNPLHPLHPFKHEFNVQHHYMTPKGMVTYNNTSHGSGDGSSGVGSGLGAGDGLGLLQGGETLSYIGLPHITVNDDCDKVKRQAMLIATKLLKKQNKKLFTKIMNYLLKSKYLIGVTELKLNKILKTKISNAMHTFTRLTSNNVQFVDVQQQPELSDDDDEENSDVQEYDFSEETPEHPHGSAGEMEQMMQNEMEKNGNPHISD